MYLLLNCFAALISRLSPASLGRVAGALTFLFWDVLRLRRSLVLRNLTLAFPEKTGSERRRIGRASLYNFALTALEFCRGYGTDIAAQVDLAGLDHVRGALGKGQGAYILCFHLGNWEAMGAASTRHVAPSHVLVKKVGSSSVDRFVSELRAKSGFLTVKRQKKGDGFAAIKDVLAKGEIVGFVMDQARPGEPKLPFFGHPAKTNTSLAAIWRRIPAPVLPAFIQRLGPCRHTLEFLPELTLATTGDAEQDVLNQSTLFNAVVEQCVRRCPEQYFWMHNRWK